MVPTLVVPIWVVPLWLVQTLVVLGQLISEVVLVLYQVDGSVKTIHWYNVDLKIDQSTEQFYFSSYAIANTS